MNEIDSHRRNGDPVFSEVFMLRFSYIFLLLFSILFLFNCDQNKKYSPVSKPVFYKCEMNGKSNDLLWHDSDLVFYKYTCYIKNEDYESFSFGKDSLVSAEIGCLEKELMAPFYYWHVDSSGALIIGNGQNDIQYKMIKLKVDDSSVTVCSNGLVKTFKYLKRKQLLDGGGKKTL